MSTKTGKTNWLSVNASQNGSQILDEHSPDLLDYADDDYLDTNEHGPIKYKKTSEKNATIRRQKIEERKSILLWFIFHWFVIITWILRKYTYFAYFMACVVAYSSFVCSASGVRCWLKFSKISKRQHNLYWGQAGTR